MGLISDYSAMGILDRLAKLIADRDSPAGTDFFSRVTHSDDNQVEKYFIGVGAANTAQALDDALDSGALPTAAATFINQLGAHYSAIGGTGYNTLANAVATRGYRVYRMLAALLTGNSLPAAGYLFDDDVSLGTFVYGGSFVAGSNLNSAVQSARAVLEVGTGAIGVNNWTVTTTGVLIAPTTTLSVAITDAVTSIALTDASDFPSAGCVQIESEQIDYTGKSTNTLTGCTRASNGTAAAAHASATAVYPVQDVSVTIPGLSAEATQWGVGQTTVDAVAIEGQTTLPVTATTGFLAGQQILIVDNEYGVALASDAADGQADIVLTDADPFSPGDAITIRDLAPNNEALTVLSVNYETNTLTCTGNLVAAYTTADSAMIYLQTGAGNGWVEKAVIASVNDGVSLVLSAALKHSYYDNAAVNRLYSDITALATGADGNAGDDVIAKAVADRTIAL